MGFYDGLGVTPVVNAAGAQTRFGGNRNELWINRLAETGRLSFEEAARAWGVSGLTDEHGLASTMWFPSLGRAERIDDQAVDGQPAGEKADHSWAALFADPGYATLTRSVLSTSSLRGTGSELVCFGPVVDEGFGLSYGIHPGSTRAVITNFHGLAADFAELLERSMRELRALVSDR